MRKSVILNKYQGLPRCQVTENGAHEPVLDKTLNCLMHERGMASR